ncbi:DUF1876 domain-containing protein [Saccharomonospora piscinae]|uniref:DUF1876 domain-containing protein n=1 Tax=Saccharomonospora piscinae TaxID=687388 RepID=A0A1V9AB54_SACPI|nr:DUF1876 domain-containing protein [Saccharomonospora piscinae]OQO94154.1 hypothetical protein B1813_05260 [Saccharomonospora piscinae]TLW95388.1 DUF1876 domain-containing protein [Saccharomonospora piscinae]
MEHTTTWTMNIVIDEHDGQTRAEALLRHGDGTTRTGTGLARRNPRDTDVPEIGDELAVARALADLSHQLLESTATDIEAVTHRPAHLAR